MKITNSKNIKRIASLLLAVAAVFSLGINAFAADVDTATIDTSKKCSVTLYKYDLTNAEKDGVWDSSYVSTGVYDPDVNNKLGGTIPAGSSALAQTQGNGDVSNGYAIKGVEFSYYKLADICTYTEVEGNNNKAQLLYGFPQKDYSTSTFLRALNMTGSERYTQDDTYWYFTSDVLVDHLKGALATDPTTTKNSLEQFMTQFGGTAMPLTTYEGKTEANGLDQGLYLFVETEVPEKVTSTCEPFLLSLPMTSVDGGNAELGLTTDGGTRWLYDVTMYPKNLTGIPSLEKTVRESAADGGHNNGSTKDITDGYAHTATASAGDTVEYQIISTLPSITSASTYLSQYTFVDTLSKGITYNRDAEGDPPVVIEFFTDAACTNKVSTWRSDSDDYHKFDAKISANADGSESMTITMTAQGLAEINSNMMVYQSATRVNAGYSDCTMRITYSATVDSDESLIMGDQGNPNNVVLTWSRSGEDYIDTLVDDCHVYAWAIDLTKQFSDGKGDMSKVEFSIQNTTDGYYVVADLHADGIYYMTGRSDNEAGATHFIPTADGQLLVQGLEDDTYVITELRTASGYVMLQDNITVVITANEGAVCGWYETDGKGLMQNDDRFPAQKKLAHNVLTATSTVDGNAVALETDKNTGSNNAAVPITVVNTKGFDLPRTGSDGNWMYPAIGVGAMILAGFVIFVALKKKNKEDEEGAAG